MDSKDIQKQVDALLADMIARGLQNPKADVWLIAQSEPQVYMHWDEGGFNYGRTEIGRGETVEDAISNAWEILEAIPPKADRDRAEFTRLLAQVIDKGNDIGIEVDMLNPLQAMMQKLSENAITYRPKPVEDPEAPYGRDADGTPFPF